jgi:hypothetical protein
MNRTVKSSKRDKSRQQEIKTVFNLCQITKQIMLPITAINQTLLSTLENVISEMICGKCIVDGYVKPGSIQIITYSSGMMKGTNVIFDVVFNCQVCFPVAGMKLKCIAKNITKAGIRAESSESEVGQSPFVLYVARDHSYDNKLLNSIKVGEEFIATVIDKRFELNDNYISIIGEIYEEKTRSTNAQTFKPSIEF